MDDSCNGLNTRSGRPPARHRRSFLKRNKADSAVRTVPPPQRRPSLPAKMGNPLKASDYWMPAGASGGPHADPLAGHDSFVLQAHEAFFCATPPLDCEPPRLKSM